MTKVLNEDGLRSKILRLLSSVHGGQDRSLHWIYHSLGIHVTPDAHKFDDSEDYEIDVFRGVLSRMEMDGLLYEVDHKKSGLHYRLTEQAYDQLPAGEGLRRELSANEVEPRSDGSVMPLSVDARSWTGRRLVLTDEAIIRDIRTKAEALRAKVYATTFTSNSDSQDLKRLCDALVSVSEMAEPDMSIIDRILRHPKFRHYEALFVAVATIRGALGI